MELPGSSTPTPPRTPCGGSSGEGAKASAGGVASPSSPTLTSTSSTTNIVVGFGVPAPLANAPSAGERAAARRRKPANSPLAALLRSRNTSFPSLPALKTPQTCLSLSCKTPPPPLHGITTPSSAMDASPCSSSRRTRSYSDLSGCSTPLSRSSDPIAIPPARMAALIGQEAALMEELSSAESGGRFGLPPTTPASALRRAESATAGTATGPATGPATTSPFAATAAAAHRPSSLSGSLRDIQQLMDEQGQAGAARLLAELAAAQAERDALASDAAALKAAAERAEEGSSCRRRSAHRRENDDGGGGENGHGTFGGLAQKRRPASAVSPPPPPQATFLFDDLDLGPPAGSGSRNAVAF